MALENEFSTQSILLRSISNATTRAADKQKLQSLSQEVETAGAEMARVSEAAGKERATAKREEGSLLLGTQDELETVKNSLIPPEVLIRNGQAVREAQAAVQDSMARVHRLESVDLFTNPVGFIMAQLRLPAVKSEQARAQQKFNVVSANATQAANMVSAEARAIQQTAKTTNIAAIEAEAKAKELDGARVAAEARIAAARNNTAMLESVRTLGTQELNEAINMHKLLQDDKLFALQMENQRMAMAQNRRKLEEQKVDDKFVQEQAEAAAYQAELLKMPKLAQQIRSVRSVPELKVLLSQPRMDWLRETGTVSRERGTLFLGDNPIKAQAALSSLNVRLDNPGLNSILSTVSETRAQLYNDPEFLEAKTAKEQEAVFTRKVQAGVKSMPLLPPEVTVMAYDGKPSALRNLPLFKVIEYDNNPAVQKSFDEFVKATKLALAEGRINPADAAAGLSQFAQQAVAEHNTYYNFGVVGTAGKARYDSPKWARPVRLPDGKLAPVPYDFSKYSDAMEFAMLSRPFGRLSATMDKLTGAVRDERGNIVRFGDKE